MCVNQSQLCLKESTEMYINQSQLCLKESHRNVYKKKLDVICKNWTDDLVD